MATNPAANNPDATRPAAIDSVRAVSLVPSITESLLAWGITPVACTKYCEQPQLEHVGGTKNPDIDAIAALLPDVVLVDRVENRKEDADAMIELGIHVVDIDVQLLSDVASQMAIVAGAVGIDEQAIGVPGPRPIQRTAFVPIWRRPWMTIGAQTYGSTLLEALGIGNVFADAASDFPEVTLEEVALRSPDLVLVPSEPYEFTAEHLHELTVVGGEIIEIDGQDLFWWGVRTPVAIERLAAQLG